MTIKMEKFCTEYPVDFNATQAATRAGYSKKTASIIAYKLLRNTKIQEKMKEVVSKAIEKIDDSLESALTALNYIAHLDPKTLFDSEKQQIHITDLSEDTRRAIRSFDVVVRTVGDKSIEYVTKIKFWDKGKALESLLKYHLILRAGELPTDDELDFGGGVVSFKKLITLGPKQIDNWIQHGNILGPKGSSIEDGEFKEVK